MFNIEELKKIKESLTDFGDIVWNDSDDHDYETIKNLNESIALINKAINGVN